MSEISSEEVADVIRYVSSRAKLDARRDISTELYDIFLRIERGDPHAKYILAAYMIFKESGVVTLSAISARCRVSLPAASKAIKALIANSTWCDDFFRSLDINI